MVSMYVVNHHHERKKKQVCVAANW